MTEADLETLKPLVAQLRGLQRHCRPFGSDYDAVAISLAALDELAETVSGERGTFGAHGDASGPMPRNQDIR